MSPRFWSYDPFGDGFDTHPTAEAARAAAEASLTWAAEQAASEGWPDETNAICWGPIAEAVVQTERRPLDPDETGADYFDEIADYALVSLPSAERRLREVLAIFYGDQADRAAALDEEAWRAQVLAYLARVHGAAGLTWARQARPEAEDVEIVRADHSNEEIRAAILDWPDDPVCTCAGPESEECPVCGGWGRGPGVGPIDGPDCEECAGWGIAHNHGCPVGGGR